MQIGISRDEMMDEFKALGEGVPDAEQYQKFCKLYMTHPFAPMLAKLDPFSDAYANVVVQLYLDLRGREGGYDPDRDEDSGFRTVPDIWSEIAPWSFKDVNLISEFLLSWAQMMRCLDIQPGSDAKILEYGTGSGQFLLMLARLGLRTYAVDIDEGSLAQVRAQAEAMKLDVCTERARFGEGFENQNFDRIIFFEAFHHAIDFLKLLSSLQRRLRPGGRLVFCGEPIVGAGSAVVPYPWGPRLDALSIFCIRRWGWMELGFTEDFFISALQRKGWTVEHRPSAECGRANVYVARSYLNQPLNLGDDIKLGIYSDGWHAGEGSHRWTKEESASLPVSEDFLPAQLRVRLFNPLPIDRLVTLSSGDRSTAVLVPKGTEFVDVFLSVVSEGRFTITSALSQPDTDFGIPDCRTLGIAVREIEVSVAHLRSN